MQVSSSEKGSKYCMEAYEMVNGFEDDEFPIPDQAKVKVLTEEGVVYDITRVEYEETTNTAWLKVEEAE